MLPNSNYFPDFQPIPFSSPADQRVSVARNAPNPAECDQGAAVDRIAGQCVRPLTNAQRQKRFRDRKKEQSLGETSSDLAIAATQPDLAVVAVTDADALEAETSGTEVVLCESQEGITATIDHDGYLIIRQACWPDEDQRILVARRNIDGFIDQLCDVAGIPAVGR